jgi:Domain of unknown function (DUF1833)
MPISETARRAMYSPTGGGEVALTLLTVSHPDLVQPIRLVNNTEPITSRGNVFSDTAFEEQWPPDVASQDPTIYIRLNNASQVLLDALSALTSEPSITCELVIASDPDTVIRSIPALPIYSSEGGLKEFRLIIGGNDPWLLRSFPRIRFNLSDWPGMATST